MRVTDTNNIKNSIEPETIEHINDIEKHLHKCGIYLQNRKDMRITDTENIKNSIEPETIEHINDIENQLHQENISHLVQKKLFA